MKNPCIRCSDFHEGDAGEWQCYRHEAQRAWKEVDKLRARLLLVPSPQPPGSVLTESGTETKPDKLIRDLESIAQQLEDLELEVWKLSDSLLLVRYPKVLSQESLPEQSQS